MVVSGRASDEQTYQINNVNFDVLWHPHMLFGKLKTTK